MVNIQFTDLEGIRTDLLGPVTYVEIKENEIIGPGGEVISHKKNGKWFFDGRDFDTVVCS